jgi:hypothetical protein
MITERSSYTLDADQLQRTVQALEKAAETLRPRPNEERLYRVLGIFVRVAVAALASILLLALVIVILTLAHVQTPVTTVIIIAALIAVFFIFAAIGALVFLLLNLSVVIQAFRQRRLLKKLGIKEVSLSAWKLQRRGHRWSRLAGVVLTWCVAVSLVIGVLAGITMWIGWKKEGVWTAASYCGLFITFGVTALVWRFVQRSREQWAIVADAKRLRSVLESMQTKAGAGEAVAIPAAMVEDVARIERVQIAREQRDAVAASAGSTDPGYAVLVARDLSLQKKLLDPQQRIAVEGLIENLSANPHPPSVESPGKGLLSIMTPERDVELQYSIDEGARCVRVLALTAHDHG